ncbi:MAG: MazG nucleotide pyrophosphohydrolase domain-containing protein, partial [Bacteroidota bacterium]
GFDWPEWEQAWKKVNEEIEEFRETLRSGHREEQSNEFGDVLFSLVNMGRIFGLQAEDSLRKTNRKFEQRFRYIEEQSSKENRPLKELSLEEMDQHWEDAKKEL